MKPALLDAAEAREQLALRCALDRLQLKLMVRRASHPPGNPLARTFNTAEDILTFGHYLPGPLGRWAGYLRTALNLSRQWLRFR